MRGKHVDYVINKANQRIIPAHAGQTRRAIDAQRATTDHPRACGANAMIAISPPLICGSSPRMRGKPANMAKELIKNRIIPAHAGQTRSRPPTSLSRPDHPRACGANTIRAENLLRNLGSSPRMRGKLAFRLVGLAGRRIIPAHAGQTPYSPAIRLMNMDHPRACGANSAIVAFGRVERGSSPRMRGKLQGQSGRLGARRIIPAHAGQTECPPTGLRRCPDHPRACGANSPILCENS